ncbi:hypothetical protein [Devosia rhizoryzae]|uniref:Uncharacterized protein n=1 Tax=Devosia rhizoryzae TaxID=2774137 RepID=A0ABX7C1N0_9HYPH|nr:hypothetical protein [Devosia rhizoryzae]QQR38135.1 hypothetical protein JI748_10055 [Devosia rhizoryzae]
MRFAPCRALVLALATPASAEPFHHPYGEWREYNRDWLAACPDAINEDAADFYGFSCFASTGSQQLNGANLPAYKLTLMRNRLDGALDLAITVALDEGGYDESRPMVLRFGGQPDIELGVGDELETRYNTINQYFVVDAARAEALIDKMKERTSVTLLVPLIGVEKPAEVRLSLQGVLASLDFMSTYARKVAQY